MECGETFDIRAWRKKERARLLEARRTMPLDAHHAASEVIAHALMRFLAPSRQFLVGCYWPFRREWNCIPYMCEVLRCGGRVALPVVVARDRPLEFRCWNEETKMEAGVWNIPHPASGPAVQPGTLLVPLVGFDEAGFRLGYGAGYYDATIAAFAEQPLTVGVGFEFSRVPTIYPQPHDRRMDVIVTEAGVRESVPPVH
jgi:5-formyltetrahydrofolate cyclo-ligase